jgi:hypothetical protein
MQRISRYILVGAGVFALYAFLSGPDEVDLNASCEPTGAMNTARSMLQGSRYWRSQLALLTIELQRTQDLPQVRARFDAAMATSKAQTEFVLDSIHASTSGLGPRPRPSTADSLRLLAEDIENAEAEVLVAKVMLERTIHLVRCRPTVLANARG